jgi:crotonobetainyl-CoA:carnitine CoA-transferase CaiB-like acyl-CoA transferase
MRTTSLAGIKVLDLSRILAGPTATQLLGDLGADVVKVEKPEEGDDTRTWGPPYAKDVHGEPTRESAYYLCANRNKRSIAIDLNSEAGRERLHHPVAYHPNRHKCPHLRPAPTERCTQKNRHTYHEPDVARPK